MRHPHRRNHAGLGWVGHPEPFSLQKYSGKFMIRTTSELHRQLAMQAAEAGVSPNRLVNSRLTEGRA
ncbi:MAG: type II toxin-antitoxin system HicB family antitoxin [Desulfovibrio sp.]|nr:type II toxin-antitoxin system HicB family antitoxin [Desulfovibrio sp.]